MTFCRFRQVWRLFDHVGRKIASLDGEADKEKAVKAPQWDWFTGLLEGAIYLLKNLTLDGVILQKTPFCVVLVDGNGEKMQ